MRYWFLATLAIATAVMFAVIGYELVMKPVDIWLAFCYVAGTILGITLERGRPRR